MSFIKNILFYMSIGNSFINKFVAPIGFSLSLFNFMKLYNIILNTYQLIILLFSVIIGFYLSGIIYDKFGIYKYDLEISTKKNLYLIELVKNGK